MTDERRPTPPAIDLNKYRPEGATCWELPPWGHKISRGVFPLLTKVDNHLLPTGTAFAISSTGVLMTALHNVRESLKHHPRGQSLLQREELPEHLDLGRIGLFALHNHWVDRERLQINLWSIEGGHGAPPSDILLTPTRFQDHFPFQHLRLSFTLPRVGSKVTCLGYSDAQIPDGALSIEDLKAGRIDDWFTHYQHKLVAVEGKVRYVFSQRFLPSYLTGPCFVVDSEVRSGMSGGPVLNSDGDVCGVVSATASRFFSHPATLVSPLYPALMTRVKFGIQLGPMRLNAIQPLYVMIGSGAVLTDGTEEMVSIQPDENDLRIGFFAHNDDAEFIFEDFYGFTSNSPATGHTGNHYRIRVHPRKQREDEDSE